MVNTSLILAAGVAGIYIIFGPLVVLAIYIFFNRMAEAPDRQAPRRSSLPGEKDPALWTPEDVGQYLKNPGKN